MKKLYEQRVEKPFFFPIRLCSKQEIEKHIELCYGVVGGAASQNVM